MKAHLSLTLVVPWVLGAYAAYAQPEGRQVPLILSAAAPKPSATCTSQLTPLTLELGQGIPLPRMYSNPTGNRVIFIITLKASSLFGMAREVSRVNVPAHSGLTMSAAPAHPTFLHTPLTSARVVFEVTTNRTGNEIVGRCDYQVTTKAPPGVPGKIPHSILGPLSFLNQVPVRICVLEGSVLAAGKKPGELIAGTAILDLLKSVNGDIWFPQAQIAFSTSIDTGFPVVKDPSPPPNQGCGSLGDLDSSGFANGDGPFAETACANGWQEKYPGRVGMPVIFARDFCNSGPAKGGAPGPSVALQVKSRLQGSGQRGDDLCGVPKRLTAADIMNQNRRPFVILIEPAKAARARDNLAHELGHNLFLGHGNGLDDNKDGRPAGTRGPSPRRYDHYCDPGWLLPPDNVVLAEDANVRFVDCERAGSLMQESGTCPNLQPLQVETARGVARLMPGFVDGAPARPGLDPGIF